MAQWARSGGALRVDSHNLPATAKLFILKPMLELIQPLNPSCIQLLYGAIKRNQNKKILCFKSIVPKYSLFLTSDDHQLEIGAIHLFSTETCFVVFMLLDDTFIL